MPLSPSLDQSAKNVPPIGNVMDIDMFIIVVHNFCTIISSTSSKYDQIIVYFIVKWESQCSICSMKL